MQLRVQLHRARHLLLAAVAGGGSPAARACSCVLQNHGEGAHNRTLREFVVGLRNAGAGDLLQPFARLSFCCTPLSLE